jgi:hypothetical protein
MEGIPLLLLCDSCTSVIGRPGVLQRLLARPSSGD